MKVEPREEKVKNEQVMPSVKIKSELPQQPVGESKPVFTVDIPTMHCQLHGNIYCGLPFEKCATGTRA